MKDGFNRDIDYLKISLTDKCNLRCVYCIREDTDFSGQALNKFLKVDDYKFIIKSMSKLGIKKIEFTGGEPLLDSNLCELIYFAKNNCNIEEVTLTTNGIDFYKQAANLKNAGLDQVNIGINSLKEYRYNSITRNGSLCDVLKSFNTALKLNIETNIDTLIIKGFNDDEIYDFIEFAKNFPITLRFFEVMQIGEMKSLFEAGYLNIVDIMDNIEGISKVLSNDKICRNYYKLQGAKGKIGVASVFNDPNCWSCNKILLSYDGKLRLCTYSDKEYDILPFLNKPITFSEFIKDVIPYKPKDFDEIKNNITSRNINEI
ncbi:MAG: radical SAM protein [Intestinibacter sp.]|uniref:radical SAM protein n=1 Tax=Intestinibacter sp. TaxID=1965304 RepID=UPI0025C206B7|nr:radical SAM protein [Intestinibacter sp.]MCI6737773.1 radical SAM protein [Intestinibacter sp.]